MNIQMTQTERPMGLINKTGKRQDDERLPESCNAILRPCTPGLALSYIREFGPSRPNLQQTEEIILALERIYQQGDLQDEYVQTDALAVIFYGLNGRRAGKASELRARFFRLLHVIYQQCCWSLHAIQQCIGISPAAASKGFRQSGLKARSTGEKTPDAPPPRRKHTVLHTALDDLGSPETAYIIGYLWADGRLLWRKGRTREGLRVGINPRDIELLHHLQRFFESDAEITTVPSQPIDGKSHPGLVLSIYSSHLAGRLAALGFADRLQGTNNVAPPSVPPHVEADFWRGMWDSDGHITRDKRVHFPLSGWEMGLSGSAAVIDALESFLQRRLQMPLARIRNGYSDVNFRGYVTGVRAPILAELLYPRDHQALSRKYRHARGIAEARAEGLRHGLYEGYDNSRRLKYYHTKAVEPYVAGALRHWLE